MTTKVFHIIGQVLERKTRREIAGFRVEAWDKDCVYDDKVGSAVTGDQGGFRITFSETSFREYFGDRRPDLYFKVFRGTELIESTEDSVLWNVEAATIPVEIGIDIPALPQPEPDKVDLIGHRITGQLLDQKTGKPLPRFIVHAFDLDAGPEPKDIGYDLTDAKGLFTVTYTTQRTPKNPKKAATGRKLRLHILDRQKKEIHHTEIRTHADPRQIVEVRVPMPEASEPPSPTLREVAGKSKLKIPKTLLDALAQRGIRTLTDVRRQGGLRHLQDLSVPADTPALQLLDAHANLGMISPDIELNDALIVDKGFRSIGAIARAPREEFVAAAYEKVGQFKAAQMHVKAKAQTRFLSNVLMGLKADWANGLPVRIPGITNPHIPQWFRHTCECKDCESAVSPQAYLADLLDYAVQHLRNDEQPVDIGFLVNRFHQPFSELSTSCEASSEQIRQVRICIEVLRAYRHHQPLADDNQRDYCLAAYTDLLTRIGTSYQELRLAPRLEEKKRKSLANRLGIGVTHLDELRLEAAQITELRLEELFGLRDTGQDEPWQNTAEPALIETWRLDYLRDVWRQQDWPQDPYVESTEQDDETGLLPVIDPDLIGPDDFRHPQTNENNPDQPFDIWVRRRRWVDERLGEFASAVNAQGVRDIQTLLDCMGLRLPEYPDIIPWANVPTPEQLEELLQDISAGTKQKVLEATSRIEGELHLMVASFTRLMAIRAKYQDNQNDSSNEAVSEEEWRELFSILVQAQKITVFPAWRQEELAWRNARNVKTLLGPRDFWLSLREPVEGDWPPLKPIANRPWIDPDVIKPEDLPEPTVGQGALVIWQDRNREIEGYKSSLRTGRKSGGLSFEQLVQSQLGQTEEAMSVLELELDSGDPNRVSAATHLIETQLYLTVEVFRRLREIGARGNRLSSDDWEEVYMILIRAVKERDWIPGWFDVEHTEGLNDAELRLGEYWRALKARLPRWRASAEARQQWQQALKVRSQSPVIDPDLIDTGRLKNALNGSAAIRWLARQEWVDSRLGRGIQHGEIETRHLDAGLDAILHDSLGVEASTLADIDKEGEDGTDITARVEQLSLTLNAFRYLLRVRQLAEVDPEGILPSEWQDIYAILFQVKKRRRLAEWRQEEQEEDIILGPDAFKLPEPPALQFPPPESPPLPAWRATFRDQRDWDQRLQSRIDQQQAIIDGLRSLVSHTEAACLPLLRDYLIDATRVPDVGGHDTNARLARAKWLTDHLLIDARAGGCQMTTRISQAIETLQDVLWSVRTGQLADTDPNPNPTLRLNAPYFDEEWQWIGSYATWRAAMFLFIYPENILLPSLRQRQTLAFRRLVNELRGNRQLTPDYACAAAGAYYEYFKDVCSLKVEASILASTHLHTGMGCHQEDAGITVNLVYLFARPRGKKTVYWSSYNPQDDSGYAQTFWDLVPSLENVISIIGAKVYYREQRTFFLFARTETASQQKLVFSRYDLENQVWQGEPNELDLPEGTTSFEAAIIRRDEVGKPPWLRIKTGRLFYERQLNPEGTAWTEGDWQPMDRVWEKWSLLPEQEGFNILEDAAITAVARNDEHIVLFMVGDDERVRSVSWDVDHGFGSWSPIGENNRDSSAGSFVAAVARHAGHIDLFVLRKDGDIYHSGWDADAPWSRWANIGGSIQPDSVVTAIVIDGNIHLFILSGEYPFTTVMMSNWSEDPGVWYSSGLGIIPSGSIVTAASRPVEGYATFAIGHDGRAYVLAADGGFNWRAIGDEQNFVPSESVITAVARDNGSINLFVVDNNEKILTTSLGTPDNITSWRTWSSISDPEQVAFRRGSIIAAVKTTGDHVNLFAIATDGTIYGTWSDPNHNNGDWNPWFPIGLASYAASERQTRLAAVRYADQIHLFIVGEDERIYYNSSLEWPDVNPITVNLPEGYQYKPQVVEPFRITAPNSETYLQQLRGLIAEAFGDNPAPLDLIPRPLWNLAYLEEAYYFVPLHVALQLQAAGQYVTALDWFRTVYDYSASDTGNSKRKISYVLVRENSQEEAEFDRADDWLLDPLSPHAIAALRPGTYTRFTLMSLVRCFLEYADAEFTRDTAESVPRARVLYTTALELLDLPELTRRPGCEEPRARLPDFLPEDNPLQPIWEGIVDDLYGINDAFERRRIIAEIMNIMGELDPDVAGGPLPAIEARLAEARNRVDEALVNRPSRPTVGVVVAEKAESLNTAYGALLGHDNVAKGADRAGAIAGGEFLHAVSLIAGVSPGMLVGERVEIPWLGEQRFGHMGGGPGLAPGSGGMEAPIWKEYEEWTRFDPWAPSRMSALVRLAWKSPEDYIDLTQQRLNGYQLDPSIGFCIPRNPVLEALRLHAELNLYKLRTCRNIAGMERQLEPYAAATDTISGLPMIGTGGQLILPGTVSLQPTPYRYPVLIERAKQLVQLAAQIESAMLSALEKHDAEAYTVLKARQDISLARSGVTLQELKVREAEGGVKLADLQQERAQIQVDTYQEWIEAEPNAWELAMLEAHREAESAQIMAAFFDAAAQLAQATASASLGAGALGAVALATQGKYLATSQVIQAETRAKILEFYASLERRKQEWELQKNIAEQDVRIASQQVNLAKDQVRLVVQERVIAKMQADHANETLEFLTNKFTNVELYDWMSNVLEGVYSFFLQRATAMAKLAENQLAFERQEAPVAFIQSDYWEVPSDNSITPRTDGRGPDRRGLTGSARLLQDIYQLDQHAFETNKRKLQLSKTISLARLAPFEFQLFRETGVITLGIPMELFDRDFPGHYLRLIHKVRTSVIALIPPTEGIRATLSTTGLSRVVIGPEVFQSMVVRRTPESVALSSPSNATGLFELEAQSEMLLPFEGMGVDTTWELRMPKGANFFDYRTIADVLLTIEYSALQSFDYQQQVIQTLSPAFSADRPFSFRHQFADQWYDLHNPDQAATPMTVRFKTVREDFPPNLDDLRIDQVVLYFARAEGQPTELPVTSLRFSEQGGAGSTGGEATPIEGVISTRRGNAGSWMAMIGKPPMGMWELVLPNTQEIRTLFKNKEIEDILFVITYLGRTPEWPS